MEIQQALAPLIATLPPGYRIETGGNIEDAGKANAALLPLFPIMIALTLLVIVLQTRSLAATTMVFLTAPLGLVGAVAMVLLAPIAASIIQLAISRQREYAADATGARISGSANALADALERLEAGAKAMPMQVNQAAEPLYIVKPFAGGGMAALFSTHPPIEERVRRLRALGI